MEKKWWKESVVYQIYPRSFADSNSDGIGDLNGITEHLEYLQKLGVDVIWLSPVYQSPGDDNGYDISDYQAILNEFGTMDDFDQMLAKAHQLGMRIVMDLVVNHTSDEHPWFIESRSSRENSFRDFYIWREGKKGTPPNNWGACFGGSAWEWDELTQMYYLHMFSPKQPDLNWENEKMRQAIYDMMNWWCQKGIDGFRMDVISMISKHPDLPDGEITAGLYGDPGSYVFNGPKVHEYLQEMNRAVLSKYDILAVGETSGVTVEEAKRYANSEGTELNMVFQFEHVSLGNGPLGKWTDERVALKDLRKVLNHWQTGLGKAAWNSLYWSNHDQPRGVSRFGNDSPQYREMSAKMLATCLHMMQGTPYIYQGEELGMTNIYFDDIEDYRDIESINAYYEYSENNLASKEDMIRYLKAKSRDNARTPMQWDDTANAGFSTATPWIKVNPNYTEINAAKQIDDPDSVYHYYRQLIALRKAYDIIVYGEFKPLLEDSDEIYAYERILDNQRLLILCNFTTEEVSCDLDLIVSNESPEILIHNYPQHTSGCLKPYEAIVYKL